MIFLFFNDLLPNMVMSRDTDSLFWKFVIMNRFLIKFKKTCQIWCCYCYQNKGYDVLKICWAEFAPPPPMWNRDKELQENRSQFTVNMAMFSTNTSMTFRHSDAGSWRRTVELNKSPNSWPQVTRPRATHMIPSLFKLTCDKFCNKISLWR